MNTSSPKIWKCTGMSDSIERCYTLLEGARFDLADAKHLELFNKDRGRTSWHTPVEADKCFTSGESKGSLTVIIGAMAEARAQANKVSE